jgi:ribosomal protein S18 acetylase RimI-like enzyme
MVLLRRMSEDEFQAFFARSVPEYAEDKVRAGNWRPEKALERSRQEHLQLLPAGRATPHMHLFTIESDGQAVGRLWLSSDPAMAGGNGFIFDLFIEPASRRRGIAAEALRLLEKEASQLGLPGLALHVFGDNLVARHLYEKLGYEITNLNMAKRLA